MSKKNKTESEFSKQEKQDNEITVLSSKSSHPVNPDSDKFPPHWEIKKLGEVCEFVRGPFGGSLKKSVFQNDGYAVYEQQHAIYNQFNQIRYFINESKFNEMKRFELLSGDLIMSCSGTMGKIALVPSGIKKGIINQALLKLTPSKKIFTQYLQSFIQSESFQDSLKKYSGGAAIQNVASVSILKQLQIPLPPLPEQKEIVRILDRCFEAIDKAKANTEQNLKNAKELFNSYLNNIFTNKGGDWEVKRLGEVCENLDSKRVPITKNKRSKGTIPYYGASGIVDYVNDFIFNEDLLCISEDGANLLMRTYPIAFSISGKTWVNNHAHVLKFENRTTQKYIELYVNSIKIDDYVSGMAQPKLNQSMLSKISIPLPPLSEQKVIVQKLDTMREETKRLEAIYEKKLVDLEEMKKSILQKAFTGQLTIE